MTESKRYICLNCGAEITINGEDLKSKTCPCCEYATLEDYSYDIEYHRRELMRALGKTRLYEDE